MVRPGVVKDVVLEQERLYSCEHDFSLSRSISHNTR